jgi:hypothetical protein
MYAHVPAVPVEQQQEGLIKEAEGGEGERVLGEVWATASGCSE